MTTDVFREEARKLIQGCESKVWLTQVRGHRLEFLCSAGGEQLKPITKLARRGTYILLGQQVPDDVARRLEDMLEGYALAHPPEAPPAS